MIHNVVIFTIMKIIITKINLQRDVEENLVISSFNSHHRIPWAHLSLQYLGSHLGSPESPFLPLKQTIKNKLREQLKNKIISGGLIFHQLENKIRYAMQKLIKTLFRLKQS